MSEVYYLILLVPIVVTAVFYFIKKHEFTWWEFFIPIGSVLILILISKLIIDSTSVRFTEYWGSTIIGVFEEEPWNEWHTQMCSYTTSDSKGNMTTHYYDCSHQDDYAPEWYAVTDIDENFAITEKLHDELVKQFKTDKKIINSRQNHSPRSRAVGSNGTKFEGKTVGKISYVYETVWNSEDNTRKAYVSQHTYVNKIKASDLTIFNISLVTDEQADSLKLFKYPEYKGGGLLSYTQGTEYPTVLGNNISNETQEKFKRLNGKFGVSNQLRLWILVFENQPFSIANYQENYWVRGNMNELVLCVGKNNEQIQWAHTFSWGYSNELTIDIRDKIMSLYTYKDSVIKKPQQPNIVNLLTQSTDSVIKIKSPTYPVLTDETWNDLYQYLNENLHRYQRRNFEEFDYLTVNPSRGAIIFILIFAIVVSIAVNFWIINNEIWAEDYE